MALLFDPVPLHSRSPSPSVRCRVRAVKRLEGQAGERRTSRGRARRGAPRRGRRRSAACGAPQSSASRVSRETPAPPYAWIARSRTHCTAARHRDLDGLDLGARALVADRVHQPGGLEHQQPHLLDAHPRLRDPLAAPRPGRRSGVPNAVRAPTRSHIMSSARSAIPIARMQWWMRPGPSRACAIAKPVALAAEQVRRRHAHVVEDDLGVAAVRPVVVAEDGERPRRS